MTDEKQPGLNLANDNPKHEQKPWARKSPSGGEQLVCSECNGSTWIRGENAPMVQRFRVNKGHPVLICVWCLANGKVVTRPTK